MPGELYDAVADHDATSGITWHSTRTPTRRRGYPERLRFPGRAKALEQ